MDIKNRTKAMKLAAPVLAATTLEQRNEALANIAKELEKQKEAIFAANKLDLDAAAENNIAAPCLFSDRFCIAHRYSRFDYHDSLGVVLYYKVDNSLNSAGIEMLCL